jgi:hypothetical protein
MLNMITTLLLAALGTSYSAPPVATLKGGIGVVSGILDSTPVIASNNTPQTITVKVNGVDTVYNNVILIVDPQHDTIGNGNTIFLVLQGSTPLLANFSGTAVTVDDLESKFFSQRSIPMSSGGQLQASFAIGPQDAADGVRFSWPAFTLNNLSFPNGATGRWNAFPSSFNLTLPTPGVNTQQTVSFPGSNLKPLHFEFHATAAAGDLRMVGDGYTNPLTVSGTMTGNPTVMTTASLDISGGTQ